MRKTRTTAPDREQELRDDLIQKSGIAIEKIIAWLLNQVAEERDWNLVPWWMKKATYTLDAATLGVLKSKPTDGSVQQMEITVQRIVTGCKDIEHGPDLTGLEASMRRYVDFRRSDGNGKEGSGR